LLVELPASGLVEPPLPVVERPPPVEEPALAPPVALVLALLAPPVTLVPAALVPALPAPPSVE
jgi:hypothetical protein